jgi:hypothetical protein
MRTRGWIIVMSGLVLFSSCAHRSSPVVRDGEPRVTVERQAVTVHGDRIGVGAEVSVAEVRSVRDIELGITFFNGQDQVRTESDTLPFCRRGSVCSWATSFVVNDAGERGVDRVEIRVLGDGGSSTDGAMRVVRAVKEDGSLTAFTPDKQGVLYLIALREDIPAFGIAFAQQRDKGATIRVTDDEFPVGNDVLAVFYEGHVPNGGAPGAD